MNNGKWLISRQADIWVMLFPVWICWIIAFSLSDNQLHQNIPLWIFVVVVIGIDVGHVWSTIFRTYVDRNEFRNHKTVLIGAPIISFFSAFGLAVISIDLFWRCLAYVALYHFVKQQFGFMRIYKAKNKDFHPKLIRDNIVIYMAMFYPILYWHLSSDREFAWFIQGDFLSANFSNDIMKQISLIGNFIYFFILGWWLLDELLRTKKSKILYAGKLLWVITTSFNWFLGIVYFNSDIVFTITNVVAHGLPYLALIIFYKGRKDQIKGTKVNLRVWIRISLAVILSVLILSFMEEYLWDALVYRSYGSVFYTTLGYVWGDPSLLIQYLAIGLLAVPQVTHYIIDGYIWKNNEKNSYLQEILLK